MNFHVWKAGRSNGWEGRVDNKLQRADLATWRIRIRMIYLWCFSYYQMSIEVIK